MAGTSADAGLMAAAAGPMTAGAGLNSCRAAAAGPITADAGLMIGASAGAGARALGRVL